jgi:sugar lactone lactonase YvrE
MKAGHFLACQCELGEGPLWFEGLLYWFDILACTLHACDEKGENRRRWVFSEPFSAAAAAGTGTLLLASASGLWRFDTATGSLAHVIGLEAGNPATRSNDGRADRHGGFWIGTMGRACEPQAGAIYRFYGGTLTQLRSGVTISNSLCFSPDGDFAYFADSAEAQILRWALDGDGCPAGEPSLFAELSDGGKPDGAVVDRNGALWSAQWGAGRVVRYLPDGSVDRVIELPVSQPSCPAFGGSGLNSLFVTSAREGMTASQLAAEPYAGDLFRIRLEEPGMEEGLVKL